jgi:hypothetical protein
MLSLVFSFVCLSVSQFLSAAAIHLKAMDDAVMESWIRAINAELEQTRLSSSMYPLLPVLSLCLVRYEIFAGDFGPCQNATVVLIPVFVVGLTTLLEGSDVKAISMMNKIRDVLDSEHARLLKLYRMGYALISALRSLLFPFCLLCVNVMKGEASLIFLCEQLTLRFLLATRSG